MENSNETTNETPVTDSPVTNTSEPVQTYSDTIVDRIEKLEAKMAEINNVFPKEKIDEFRKISQEEYDKALKEAAEFKEKYEKASKLIEEYTKHRAKEKENEAKRELVWKASGRPIAENNFADAVAEEAYNALIMGSQGGTVAFSEEGAKKAREYLKHKTTEDYNKILQRG